MLLPTYIPELHDHVTLEACADACHVRGLTAAGIVRYVARDLVDCCVLVEAVLVPRSLVSVGYTTFLTVSKPS